ncbi:hypothetical protein OSTOST_00506 [Ostertagia ostertagi]
MHRLNESILSHGPKRVIVDYCETTEDRVGRSRGQLRGVNARGKIIKIDLMTKALKDRLIANMRSVRQSLTRDFVHSYARRDYTEELSLDRNLRKQAGQLNKKAGKLTFIVRDLEIHKLRSLR